jgi:LPXTG-motif cell wall-anchored protein
MRKGSLFAVLTAAAMFLLVSQVASAQYPTPKTNLVCAVNQIDVKTGSSTAVAATLRDSSGNALSGYVVKFQVTSGDASLSSSSATTDGSGTAVVTVRFGSSAGTVVIKASSESSECQASTQVNGIVPPATGSAGLLGTGSSDTTAFAVIGLGVALIAAGVVARKRSVRA